MHRNCRKHRTDSDDKSRTKVRCHASKEASLDDIVHSYGGLDAIHLSGDNTPSHVVTAYKELNNIRRLHGEDIEDELFDFEQCDSNTIKLINKDIFFFVNHCLTNRVMNKMTDLLHLNLALVKPLEWMDPSLTLSPYLLKYRKTTFSVVMESY